MHIFDYSFLDEGLLPAEIVNLTATILHLMLYQIRVRKAIKVYILSWKRLQEYNLLKVLMR